MESIGGLIRRPIAIGALAPAEGEGMDGSEGLADSMIRDGAIIDSALGEGALLVTAIGGAIGAEGALKVDVLATVLADRVAVLRTGERTLVGATLGRRTGDGGSPPDCIGGGGAPPAIGGGGTP